VLLDHHLPHHELHCDRALAPAASAAWPRPRTPPPPPPPPPAATPRSRPVVRVRHPPSIWAPRSAGSGESRWEVRCYRRDPDGYIIEVGESSEMIEHLGRFDHTRVGCRCPAFDGLTNEAMGPGLVIRFRGDVAGILERWQAFGKGRLEGVYRSAGGSPASALCGGSSLYSSRNASNAPRQESPTELNRMSIPPFLVRRRG
jgi:hypothetical protein